jgi:hypothetical protein
MSRLEALAEMAARHELTQAEVQEAVGILLHEMIARVGVGAIPIPRGDDVLTIPNLMGERGKPPSKPPEDEP